MGRDRDTINKVRLIEFKQNTDDRGSLIAIESGNSINLKIQRVFYMYGMEPGTIRGQHANKISTMCFIVIKGRCKILVDNGTENETYTLENPAKGLICEPMTWKKMYDFSPDCILMALCDTNYNSGEYITDYGEFKREVNK
jgi:dTDP-4-dehydrorhamnose 3,5-epimerase-like enzyme